MDKYRIIKDCPGLEDLLNAAANEGFRLKAVIGKTVIMERPDYGMTVGVTSIKDIK